MRQLISDCHQRFGIAATADLEEPALSAAYKGWCAVLWVDEHATSVEETELDALQSKLKTKAGNSASKQLWRSRVMHVHVLQRYFRIPASAPKWVLPAGVATGQFPVAVAPAAAPQLEAHPSGPYVLTLANKPGVLIDRATRGPGGWNNVTLQYKEAFDDGLILNYYEENAAPEALRAQLGSLDPRTSDVWRLLTAKALENDRDDLFTPITIKPGELAKALGLKPHPNGSVRPKDLLRCTQSLFHLERLWLMLPGEKSGPQKRVLAVMERGSTRRIDGQDIPSSWTLVLGEWASYFPRSYAPIFRGLVELPANSATNIWTKQLGTELTYWYRETARESSRTRYIQVKALLQRASLEREVMELHEQKNLNRAIERFEAALDQLGAIGLHERWAYEGHSAAHLDQMQGRPGFSEVWLQSYIELVIPEEFQRSIAALDKSPSDT